MAQKSIKVDDLAETEKMVITEICKSYSEYLKEYLSVKVLPSLEDVTREVSAEFVRYKMNNEPLDKFYTMCDRYLIQLVLYAANSGRIQSLCKRLRVLKHFGIKRVVDFGSGASIDAFIYSAVGIKSINVEYPNASRNFAEWVFRKKNIKSNKAIFISPDLFMDVIGIGMGKIQATQAIEVVAHLEDPYSIFRKIMKRSRIFMWTNDIGLHREDVGYDPQHLDHNINKVIDSLNMYGEKVTIKNMAIPPRLWVNREEKSLWKKRQ